MKLKLVKVPERFAGPAWRGVVDHPRHGIVRICHPGRLPKPDPETEWYCVVGEIEAAEALPLLKNARWGWDPERGWDGGDYSPEQAWDWLSA